MSSLSLSHQELKELLIQVESSKTLSVFIDQMQTGNLSHTQDMSVVNSGLRELQRNQQHGDHAVLAAACRQAHTHLSDLLIKGNLRTLAYIAVPEKNWFWHRSYQLPCSSSFHYQEPGWIRTLIKIWHDYPPLGIVLLSQSHTKIWTWSYGILEEGPEYEIDIKTESWRSKVGPGPSHTSQSIYIQTDSYQNRITENILRHYRELPAHLEAYSKKNDWRRMLVVGAPNFSKAFIDHCSRELRDILLSSLNEQWSSLSVGEISERATQTVTTWVNTQKTNALSLLDEESESDSFQTDYREKIMEGLVQGRVRQLLIEETIDVDGYWNPVSGTYHARPLAGLAGQLRETKHLVDRMIALAFRTDADVMLIAPELAAALGKRGGVAATWRY